AHLRHVSDEMPGITRHSARHGFDYRRPEGELVRDIDTLKRIRSLVIPPAWTDFWISPAANGHLQAVGRDARGRKQYRYHSRWSEVRDETKFDRLAPFDTALPRVRRRVRRDLRRKGLPREKVLATIVELLARTQI